MNLNIITAYLAYTGANAGDIVTVSLVRTDGYGSVITQTLTIPTTGLPSQIITFDLQNAVEQPSYPEPAFAEIPIFRGVMGAYQVQATATGMSTTSASSTFYVTLVPPEELSEQWLAGVPLESLDIVNPVTQPQNITGVKIKKVSEGTVRDIHTLTFTVNSGSPNTLSWDGGTPVNIPATRDTLYLVSLDQQSWIMVVVVPFLLPAVTMTETIIISGSQMTEQALQNYVLYAVNNLENQWFFNVEPRNSDTDPALNSSTSNSQQALGSINKFFVERSEQAMTYYRPRDFSHWMSFQLPRRRILKVYHLDGWFNQSQAVSIGRDWIVFDQITGTLELVPNNGAIISWQFYGAAILQFFFNYPEIPGFWHFGFASGLPSLNGEYGIVREAIAKMASRNILAAAGFAFTGGAQSIAVSRNGVSDSRTYAGGAGGAFLLREYSNWLDINVPKIGDRLAGINMQFM